MDLVSPACKQISVRVKVTSSCSVSADVPPQQWCKLCFARHVARSLAALCSLDLDLF